MAPPVPTDVPATLTAAQTWRWDRTLELYPPSEGWSLVYRFVGDDTTFAVATSVNGSVYEVSQTPAQTAARPAGTYQVTEYVERNSGTERYTVRMLSITVKPDPLTLAPGSQRTRAEVRLASVRAVIDALVTGKVKSYTALGRTFEYHDLNELRALEKSLAATVRRQRTGRIDTPIEVVFTPVASVEAEA